MKFKFLYYFFLISGLFLVSCSNEEDIKEPLVAVEYFDKKYGNDTEQNYDIYLPENRDLNTPVIVLVHGGSWVGGDKSDMDSFVDNIKNVLPQFAITNINYRLLTITDNKHPTQIDDIDLFIKDLSSIQQENQISNKYYFLGVSAGAHLSLLYTYTKNNSGNIKAVCSIVGPTNFTDPNYINSGNSNFELLATTFLGDTYQNNPQIYEDASPLFQVDQSSAPSILFYGGNDPLIPSTQGKDLDQKLTDFNIMHEFTFYPNEGHGWEGVNAIDTMTKITAFFKKIENDQ